MIFIKMCFNFKFIAMNSNLFFIKLKNIYGIYILHTRTYQIKPEKRDKLLLIIINYDNPRVEYLFI